MTAADPSADCPYVGLQPFEERHRDYFFGRERDQRIIIANLLSSPLTVVYGSSGVGKSSVLMAGVVPQLRRDRPRTPVVVFRRWVSGDFQSELTQACIQAVWHDGMQQPKPADTLPLDEVLRECAEAARETVLVLLDQFEEFFLYHPKSTDPESFEAQFARAVNREDVDIGVLVALREDSLSKLDRFQERIPNLLSNRLRLTHLDKAGATSAIRRPLEVWNARHADQAAVSVEDGLVARLLDEVQIGRVAVGRQGGSGTPRAEEELIEAPFLQLVLTRLWKEEAAVGSRTLRLATLERLEGAKEIVRSHLEHVMATLDPTQQAVCASFFDRLVTPTGTKVACTTESLEGYAGALAPRVRAVLGILSHPDARILRPVAVTGDSSGPPSYELYHDVLAPAILDWRRRYVEGQERAHAVHQAREQAARRALRQWVVALAVMTVLAIAGWLKASWESLRAEANQKAAESIATSPYDARLGLDLALEAAHKTTRLWLPPTEAAENALRQAIQASRLEWSLPVESAVSGVAFGPDGHTLAAAAKDGRVAIWDIGAGRPRPEDARHFLHPDWVRGVVFLPGGERMATVAGGTARVWNARDPTAAPLELVQGSPIYSAIAASRDGARLATAGSGKGQRVVKVWDLASNKTEPIATIDVDGAWVMGLAFSPDGCCLATASVEPGSASRTYTEVWSIATGTRILRVPNPQPSDSVVFTPDGAALVTSGRDNRVRVWRPAVDALQRLLAERSGWTAEPDEPAGAIPWTSLVLAGHVKEVYAVAVSPDGSRIASAGGDGKVMVWDAQTGQLVLTLGGHEGRVGGVAFSPDGERLATGGHDKTLKVWNIGGHADGVWSVAFSPADGNLLATGGGDYSARLWDLSSGTPRLRHRLQGHTNSVFRLAFAPDGALLATVGLDGKAMLWNVASGKLLREIGRHNDKVFDVAFTSDGTQVATALADGTAELTPVTGSAPGQPTIPVKHGKSVSAVAFGPGSREWVTAGWDGMLRLWSRDGQSLGQIAGPDAEGQTKIFDVAFAPDGSEVVDLTGPELIVWPIAAFKSSQPAPRLRVKLPVERWCNSMSYSPDGRQLAVACADGSVRLYAMPAVTPEKTITVHRDEVTQVAFSPDGKRLATASLDKSFDVSPLRFDELYAVAKRMQAATAREPVSRAAP